MMPPKLTQSLNKVLKVETSFVAPLLCRSTVVISSGHMHRRAVCVFSVVQLMHGFPANV